MNKNYFKLPKINPIIFSIGNISLRWYGLMYFIGFIFAIWYAKKIKKEWKKQEIENIIYHSFIGMIIGSRIGYVLFYNFNILLKNPIFILKIWEGGMSFHGGLIGIIFSIKIHTIKNKYTFFQYSDLLALLTPFGLGIGRIGNLINNELYGRVTLNTPWAILYPELIYEDIEFTIKNPEFFSILNNYNSLPRHPSQIYEMLFEGIILFFILNKIHKKKKKKGIISGSFLIIYSIFRFLIEFFREPDPQLGLFYKISMGQILSIPMFIVGIIIINLANKNLIK